MIRSVFRVVFKTMYGIFAFLGLCVVLIALIMMFGLGKWNWGESSKNISSLKHDSVLSIILDGSYVEHETSNKYEALLFGSNASLYDLVRSITVAAHDPHIKGLVARIENPDLGTAQIQEIRDALAEFRKSGKPSWVYATSFGELTPGTGLYYLATGFEQIWIQPLGAVNLTGLSMEVPFGKEALEKIGVKPELIQKKEFKSFADMFTRDSMSEPNAEELQAVVDSIISQVVDGIVKDRKLSPDQVRHLVNNGPYFTEEAVTNKLIDRIDYRYNLMPTIQEKLGQDIEFIGLSTYVSTLPQPKKGPRVALIFGEGKIVNEMKTSTFGGLSIGSDDTYSAFHSAIEDPDVKAIVYRINSEGGSPVASETIYSIIKYANEKAKKPVIISMSDVAASGGYWISAAGTKIVAQPATLTGSIGAFGGKFNLAGLFEKIGIKWGVVSTSENARMWSVTEAYTPAQWMKVNQYLDKIYEGFTTRVAKHRNMTPEQVEKVARGRVWTGEQAMALGLVDQLGGLQFALHLAKKEAGLAQDASVHIYPKYQSFFEKFLKSYYSHEKETFSKMDTFLGILSPFKKVVALFYEPQVLEAPIGKIR